VEAGGRGSDGCCKSCRELLPPQPTPSDSLTTTHPIVSYQLWHELQRNPTPSPQTPPPQTHPSPCSQLSTAACAPFAAFIFACLPLPLLHPHQKNPTHTDTTTNHPVVSCQLWHAPHRCFYLCLPLRTSYTPLLTLTHRNTHKHTTTTHPIISYQLRHALHCCFDLCLPLRHLCCPLVPLLAPAVPGRVVAREAWHYVLVRPLPVILVRVGVWASAVRVL
jgi:hypothetical protein